MNMVLYMPTIMVLGGVPEYLAKLNENPEGLHSVRCYK